MKTQQTKPQFGKERLANENWDASLDTPAPAQAQHSPLPWSIDPKGYGTPWNIDAANGEQVVLCIEGIGGKAESRNNRRSANAAFIVRACNNVQRLADALKAIVEKPYLIEGQAARIEAGREALAQWEGKESPADADAIEALDQLEERQ